MIKEGKILNKRQVRQKVYKLPRKTHGKIPVFGTKKLIESDQINARTINKKKCFSATVNSTSIKSPLLNESCR